MRARSRQICFFRCCHPERSANESERAVAKYAFFVVVILSGARTKASAQSKDLCILRDGITFTSCQTGQRRSISGLPANSHCASFSTRPEFSKDSPAVTGWTLFRCCHSARSVSARERAVARYDFPVVVILSGARTKASAQSKDLCTLRDGISFTSCQTGQRRCISE